ncbi:MAG: CARDB domain-containing protein [Dehalococcoidales bacterium]
MHKLKRRLIGGALVFALLFVCLFIPALIPRAEAGTLAASSPAPDLTIASITISPDTPSIGDTVTFTVTVQNRGDGPAAASLLACFIDEQNFATSQVDAINAGAVTMITFTWKAKAGPHVFRAVIDSNDSIAESDENNNDRTIAFSVLAADLTVKAISWVPVSPAMGDTVTFTVTITNRGDKKAGSSQLDFSIDGNSRGYRTLLPIEAGASVNETYTWVALSGTHNIRAVADVLQQVAESDETNNALEATLATALPDLIINSLTVSPQSILAGDNVTLTAIVINQGSGRAVPSIVACYVDNTLWDSTYVSFLSPGETSTVTFEWTTDDNPHLFKIIADATDVVKESDETNNVATAPSPLVLPDLVIQNITWSPVSPVINTPVIFTITVANQGKCKSSYTDLKYGINTIYQFTAVISDLAPGETATTTFMWIPAYPSFTIQAAIDTANSVRESNESNNTLTKTVNCINPAPTADLIVQDLTVSPAKPVIGDTVTLSLSVKNQGTGTAVGSYAAIYLDDSRINTVFIDELSAGATINKDMPVSLAGLTYKSSYKIRVELDCNSNVLETNEFNNTKEISFSVLAPDLIVQSIEWAPELPAAGGRITFDITVKNRGDAKAGSYKISYYVDNVFAGQHLIETMEPGATVNRSFTWTVQKEPFTLNAVIDEANEIKEQDKSNNSKSVTIPAPDLVIDLITWTPEKPVEIGLVTFTVGIKNRGYGQSPGTLLYCYIDSAAPLSLKTGEIGPGGTTSITFTNSFMSGGHVIRLIADGNDAVAESDESNNEKTINISVQPLPNTASTVAVKPATAVSVTTPNPGVTPSPLNKTPAQTATGNITSNLKSAPPKWQSILQNRWLIIGVAVLGIGAIGVLLVFRRKRKNK